MGDAGFKEVADDDHVAHGHSAWQEQSPHIVQQAGLLDHQIGGNQTTAEIHGDEEENTDPLSAGQALAA